MSIGPCGIGVPVSAIRWSACRRRRLKNRDALPPGVLIRWASSAMTRSHWTFSAQDANGSRHAES